MVAICLNNVTRRFGTTQAVENLDLQVADGQIYGLIGPDGAGKTTTLRMICGALRPDHGQILVYGTDVAQAPEQTQRRIGYMPQKFSLYGDLTVAENLRFFADIYGVPRHEQPTLIERLLGFSRMTPFSQRRADRLSGGMKQKLALATVLIHRPALLLLDEPTTGVDPVSRREFWDILRNAVRNDGITVLVSTPYMDEADRCHQIGFMRAGRLLTSGTPQQLQAMLPGEVLELSVSDQRQSIALLQGMPGVSDVQMFGDRLHIITTQSISSAQIQALLTPSSVTLHSLRPVAPAMEDVFMYVQRGAS
jgi:ABC-2 type transport system ATP-binding protein